MDTADNQDYKYHWKIKIMQLAFWRKTLVTEILIEDNRTLKVLVMKKNTQVKVNSPDYRQLNSWMPRHPLRTVKQKDRRKKILNSAT